MERNEESQRRIESTEASQVEEFTRIRDENEDIKHKLRDSQASLQALANDHTAVTTKVLVLETRAKAAEERAAQEEFIRDTTIQEAVEQAMENFKQIEEYAAILIASYDTDYDTRG